MEQLFKEQVESLEEPHFLVLYWGATAEDRKRRYNITNCFDDLKFHGITRTKQTATSILDALEKLRFIDIRDEGNRKNIYITSYGARALESLVLKQTFTPKKSFTLEV
ncbi:MAG: hypothetical protein ACOCZS_02290 [Verrucomicrobiota bacterium]